MAKTDAQIVSDIVEYVGNSAYSGCYAGITADPKARLFTEHNVDENTGQWIYRQAINIEHARSAESTLIAKGFDGGSGGGDDSSTSVYAYKKTSATRP